MHTFQHRGSQKEKIGLMLIEYIKCACTEKNYAGYDIILPYQNQYLELFLT